ncbi:MAG: flagellar hook-associated protein FlgK [Pseudomonadota bacterium]|nr:flagellar hook-associated protein FlgK [Pseudomonadota bacterium]
MSDLLNIGATGIKAYQGALSTVSENIANAGTAGYSRRTTSLSEITPAGSAQMQHVLTAGGGVRISAVNRAADMFKAADVRSASTDLARSETGITWLTGIQTALTGNQLGDRLTSFFNATAAIAADPTASTPRATMIEAAKSVASAFTATGQALDQVSATLDATAQTAVTGLDNLGASLARVNEGLSRTAPNSSAAADLADQRDSILEQMSAITDVSVSTDDAGRATVRVGGANGPVLVAGNQAGSVTYAHDANGNVSFAVHRIGVNAAFTSSGGALAGIVDGGTRIVDARNQLNAIASSFTTGVNAAQAQGQDLDGNTGASFFAVGVSPTDIAVTLNDPNGIAAASVGGGTRDNSNLKAFAAVRNTGQSESKTTALIGDNAAALSARQQVADVQSSIRDNAVAARDSVSGVNLDTEAVDLMRFQQAYSASSRVIQVARETLQSILDIR